ncbi:MAG: GGDEF domain-containing protein [Lachnospiraceae bacterium]|jgi:diguanylate cyclase (GGDEF)-like protein
MFDSEFYKKILDNINSLVYITDAETNEIVYANELTKKTFGLEHPEGQICWKIFQKGMHERCSFCKINELLKYPDKVLVWQENSTYNGRVYTNTDSLRSFQGRFYHIQTSIDITDQLQLSMEATIDELTGVYNRNSGKRHLNDLLNQMEESDQFTVVLYDMNGLKWVNDTYGHLEGDRLLRFVAQTIQDLLEKPDFLFRLSGDEFIIVFMNQDLEQAEERMQMIISGLDEKKQGQFEYDVSFSYGLAGIRGGENLTVSDVLSIADAQMYIKKRNYHMMQKQR